MSTTGLARRGTATALVALAAAIGGAQEPKRPVFSADVDVVAVDVNVVDKQGRPVRGLAASDFTITVDGVARRVVTADFVSQAADDDAPPPPAPSPDRLLSTNEGLRRGRIVVVVVDQGNIRPGVGRHALRAADRLLDALSPDDRVALVTMPGGGPQVDLTTDHTRVRNGLQRIAGRAQYGGRRLSLAQAQSFDEDRPYETETLLRQFCPDTLSAIDREICMNDVRSEAFSVAANFSHQSEVSLKGLGLLMETLQQLEGPKTVVLITEGLRTERPDELRRVANIAAAARVAFFAIQIDESGIPDASRAQAPATALEDSNIVTRDLFRLSTLTRGAVFSTSGSAGPFERIAREISAYYVLGFEPQAADRDGKDHVVDVKVGRPGLTVRARRALPIAPPRQDQQAMLAATLRDPFPAVELPLRVATYSSRDATSGKIRVVVSAEVGHGGTAPAGLAVGFALTDEKGKVAATSYQRVGDDVTAAPDGPVSYLGAATVEAGRYTLKVAAVDARGRRGSVEHPVRALLTTIGPLEVSDLVLAPPASRPGVLLRPGVETTIDAGGMAGLVDLHGTDTEALRGATVTFEVATGETGPALVSAPARLSEPANGQRSGQGAVSLALVPPGRYVARAVVSIGGRPMGQVTRPVVVAPSRTGVVSPALSMAALLAPRFDRALLLAPDVVSDALDALAVGGPLPPAVAAAVAEARQGRLDRLTGLLGASQTPSAGLAFLRGLGFFAQGEMAPAAEQFREALRLRQDFVPATLYLGGTSAALGRDQDAVGAWTTAALEDGRSPLLALLMSDAQLRRGEVDAAIDLLREATVSWPADERFRHRLGLAYAGGGRATEALPLLQAHLDAHPSDGDTRYMLVRLLYAGLSGPQANREQFLRHARAYAATPGPQQALVAEWIKAVEAAPRR